VPHASQIILRLFVAFYAVGMCVWYVLRELHGDSWDWLALVNTFALYLFVPLLFLVVIVLAARHFDLLPLLGAPLALFILLFGAQWIPPLTRADPTLPTLRVMTFNVNGNTNYPERATTRITTEDADLVLIQELSPHHSYNITSRIGSRYPYRQFEPIPGRRGIGVMARYPLQDQGWVRLGKDSNAAQRLTMEWEGHALQILNVHLESTTPGENVEASFRERERQVRQLLTLVEQENVPTIVAGDFNLSDTSQAYAMLAKNLRDAHRTAGWGFGLTFPASPDFIRNLAAPPVAGLLRTRTNRVASVFGIVPLAPIPLLRIDYIFATNALRATNAYTAAWDGQSDHRAVVAEFQLE
jgi:vancomycin resistance protein VanJ